jgi:polyhydroxyalkanoate synthase
MTLSGGFADLAPVPRVLVDAGPNRSTYRMTSRPGTTGGPPVLLVPPLAVPPLCFDLRRGCSLAEHLVAGGRATYLVDYGTIAFANRRLGIEHWVYEVVPKAIRAASRDAGGRDVHVVAWCLGGIFTLLAAAVDSELPIASITAIASPFDVTAIPFLAPARPLVDLTRGHLVTPFYRLLGSAPRRAVRAAFQLSALDKYVTKPWALLTHLDDREFLAQIEAVDHFTENMVAYPGRTFGQMYHHFFRANDLYDGTITLGGRDLSLSTVTAPVLAIAGEKDTLAPKRAVGRLPELLTASEDVSFEVCPGGHLGVLTGRRARDTTWPTVDGFIDRVASSTGPGKHSGP